MLFFIKNLVTFHTKLFPVGYVSFVFPTYISPLKVSFHSLWDRIKTAANAVVSFSIMSSNPVVNSPIAGFFTFPKIVIRSSVVFTKTFSRTVLNEVVFNSAFRCFKSFVTVRTFYLRLCSPDNTSTLYRTCFNASLGRRNQKNYIADFAQFFYFFTLTFSGTFLRAVFGLLGNTIPNSIFFFAKITSKSNHSFWLVNISFK